MLSASGRTGPRSVPKLAWQADTQRLTGNRVWTPKRKNQTAQQSRAFERWLNGLRLRIEGLFNEIQNGARMWNVSWQKPCAAYVPGLQRK
jgi:hypothetical protein